jgi:hypothetical protein
VGFVPVTGSHPSLDRVFGILPAEREAVLRGRLIASTARLEAISTRIEATRTGCSPLHMHFSDRPRWWLLQTAVWGVNSERVMVQFVVELRPGAPDHTPSWEGGLMVEVDCEHREYHGYMHQVYEQAVPAHDLESAVAVFDELVSEVADLAASPIDNWLALGRD